MGKHKLPAIANRLRGNRSFESAWFADAPNYASMLQKDWVLSKNVWSFVTRSSRSLPKLSQKEAQQQALAKAARDAAVGAAPASAPQATPSRDFPNFRVGRIFMQHLPYKSVASTFAYTAPKVGPQAKYGLFQAQRVETTEALPPRK